MTWISPTGFVDPDGKWNNEPNAYDENTGSYSDNVIIGYGHYLELTHAALSCSKVQIYAQDFYSVGQQYNPDIDIDVYYGDAWHNIWSGSITKDTWVEKEIGSTQSVTAARVKFNTSTSGHRLRIFEFDFWEAAALHELTLTDGIHLADTLIKNPIKTLSDGFQLTDTLIKNPIKVLADGFALTDTWEGYKLLSKVLTDGIAFADALVKTTSKTITDGVAFTDTAYRTFIKTFTDGVAFTDTVVKSIALTLSDGVAFTDTLCRTFVRVFTDGIKFHDFLLKWRWLTPVRRLLPKRLLQPKREEPLP